MLIFKEGLPLEKLSGSLTRGCAHDVLLDGRGEEHVLLRGRMAGSLSWFATLFDTVFGTIPIPPPV